ncbi:MAG TPA: sulfatase-like hydrolase/transferase [Solirubrobacteraceae bacterium]|nr:sulfatase-like hydrolase/transferase [Solirubrobacteraceae bacterium]
MTFPRAALHLGGLWALAFAQPLFQLLGRNAEFFVARGSTAGDILLLAFGYTLVPPLVLAAIAWGLGKLRPELGWGALLVFVALLVAAFVLPPVGEALGGSALAIPVAVLLGAAAASLYARVSGVRAFATVIAVAPAVVLVLFLLVSPVRGLLFPSDAGGAVAGPARSSTPIVHVVLDELPLSTLVGTDGRIDARRFPNFARLARESTWYRNATTVDDMTAGAVPAQLTGSRPPAGALPTTTDYPRSLFTLFGRSHRLTVVEPITALCPERLCGSTRPGTWDRLTTLESDLEVVVRQQLYPEDLRAGLPAIDRVWEGFEQDQLGADGELTSEANLRRDVLARLHRDDATAGWEKAIAALRAGGSRPPLVFLHSTLPHGPWRFLPDGKQYPTPGNGYLGLASEGWVGPQWQVDQEFQRHLLQVQYVDRLLGRLLDVVPDDAVLVVAADHGSAFVSGQPKRPIVAGNAGAIAPVPFFVRLPGQTRGQVSDRAVRTMDVLPTLARAAGVALPWNAQGVPADERAVDPEAPIDVSHQGTLVLTEPLAAIEAKRRERDAVEERLLRDGIYGIGPRPDLLGRAVSGDGRTVFVDPESPVLPSFITGRAPAGSVLAVAVDGRIAQTTRAYGNRYAALVPQSSLHAGENTVATLQVLPSGELRELGP